MFGYAVLSQPNMRAILEFALRYRPLSAPMIGLSVTETDDDLNMIFTPILGLNEDSPEFRFILDFNIAMFANLSQDSLGSLFRVSQITITADNTPAARLIRDTFGVDVKTGQPGNLLSLPRELATAPLVLANPVTAAAAQKVCDKLLEELSPRSALLKRIAALLMQNRGEMMDFGAVASELGLGERTLRRRLQSEGTNFNAIRNGLRRELAIQYLTDTSMTNEDIAAALGFSDATNFAAAFRKWTSQAPGTYRR
jgi:AraC-like DNA-binding protein